MSQGLTTPEALLEDFRRARESYGEVLRSQKAGKRDAKVCSEADGRSQDLRRVHLRVMFQTTERAAPA